MQTLIEIKCDHIKIPYIHKLKQKEINDMKKQVALFLTIIMLCTACIGCGKAQPSDSSTPGNDSASTPISGSVPESQTPALPAQNTFLHSESANTGKYEVEQLPAVDTLLNLGTNMGTRSHNIRQFGDDLLVFNNPIVIQIDQATDPSIDQTVCKVLRISIATMQLADVITFNETANIVFTNDGFYALFQNHAEQYNSQLALCASYNVPEGLQYQENLFTKTVWQLEPGVLYYDTMGIESQRYCLTLATGEERPANLPVDELIANYTFNSICATSQPEVFITATAVDNHETLVVFDITSGKVLDWLRTDDTSSGLAIAPTSLTKYETDLENGEGFSTRFLWDDGTAQLPSGQITDLVRQTKILLPNSATRLAAVCRGVAGEVFYLIQVVDVDTNVHTAYLWQAQ